MENHKDWMNASSIMTGFVIVLLFVSFLYVNESLKNTEKELGDVDRKIREDLDTRDLIAESLIKEFERDFNSWNATLIKDSLTIRFEAPYIMFSPSSSLIKPQFKKILKNFCPRYFGALRRFDSISELRIEGHTSKEWKNLSRRKAYFKNMELSQDRTRSVLEYCVNIREQKRDVRKWALEKLTANGLSSSRPLCTSSDSVRCRSYNRRVEFRVQTLPLRESLLQAQR